MKTVKRVRTAVLTVLILLIAMSSVTALATASAGGRAESLVPESQAVGEEETEIEFFDGLEANSGLRDTLFIVGAICVFAGIAGFVCMFLWRRANKNRDRTQETRDGILSEIEQAERRNRGQKAQNRKKEPALSVEKGEDLYNTQEDDLPEPQPVKVVKETPIVPSTPVSMQPNESRRPRVQTGTRPQPMQPIAVRAVPATEKPVRKEQPAAPQQAPKAEQNDKYDLDSILREIREGKI